MIQDYLRAFHILSYFSAVDEYEPKWLLGVAAGKLKEYKLAYTCLHHAGRHSFQAALAGLQLAAEEGNFEVASKFSKLLKENEPESSSTKNQAKLLVKWIKAEIDKIKGRPADAPTSGAA